MASSLLSWMIDLSKKLFTLLGKSLFQVRNSSLYDLTPIAKGGKTEKVYPLIINA